MRGRKTIADKEPNHLNKKEKLAAFEGINTDILTGNKKNKEMVKLFLQGMTHKEIAAQYGLSNSRIEQILDKQARRANYYKTLLNDQEYQEITAASGVLYRKAAKA